MTHRKVPAQGPEAAFAKRYGSQGSVTLRRDFNCGPRPCRVTPTGTDDQMIR